MSVLLAVVLLYAVAASAKPDCDCLGFGPNILTKNGRDLAVCALDAEQCCHRGFIRHIIRNVKYELAEFLRHEYNITVLGFLETMNDAFEYLHENFTEHLLAAHPISKIGDAKNDSDVILSLQNLAQNLTGDNFKARRYYRKFLNAMIRYAAVTLGGEKTSGKRCVKRIINETMNHKLITPITQKLKLLNKARITLGRLSTFASEQLMNRLENATVLKDCVMDYIRTAFCHQCTEKTVPLCFQTCNALGRGCYSPYYTALKEQYNDLWTEANCVLEFANETVMNILLNESKLLDLQTLELEVDFHCGTSMNQRYLRDAAGDDSDYIEGINLGFDLNLTGPFEYGSGRDLLLCQEYVNYSFCNEEENKCCDEFCSCHPGDMCVSNCTCYDGINVTTDNETTQVFDGYDVTDQDQNPVFTFNETILNEEVERIMEEVGDPITVFLTSEEYTSASCSVLDPSDDGDDDDDDDDDDDGSADSDPTEVPAGSSFGMVPSMIVIFLSLVLALL